MCINIKSNLSRKAIFAFALLTSSAYAGHGGGYQHGHGAEEYHHGGGDGGYYHGHSEGRYHHGGGGYYHDHGGYYYNSPEIIIGIPLGGYYGPQYYPPACETVRICNPRGQCWFRQECD